MEYELMEEYVNQDVRTVETLVDMIISLLQAVVSGMMDKSMDIDDVFTNKLLLQGASDIMLTELGISRKIVDGKTTYERV
jgi:hypothetical protein